MRLLDVTLDRSPRDSGAVRLSGEVRCETAGRPPERLWFDVPEAWADGIGASGNPWLAALLPLAVTLGEPLELPLPVDPALRDGVEAVMRVWKGWFPAHYAPIAIRAEMAPAAPASGAGRTGTFFSAGVDSFHTLLRHEPGGDALRRFAIDDLVTVWGLDVPLERAAAFAALHGSIREVAAALGKTPVTLATNLRETGWRDANWGRIAQGPALAAIALVLEERYRRMLIPSSVPFHSARAWGTHPLVDPLLSTTRLELRDDGALSRRIGKTEALVGSPLALRHLHVCWAEGSERNCGRCEKCLRTLTTFELFGARDRAVTFPPGAWSLATLAALRVRQDIDREHLARLARDARALGREEIGRAIDRALRRYDLRRTMVRMARRFGWRGRAGGAS